MHILYTLFIALANNLDNIGVRIAYSIRGIKITILKNLWISIITFFISSFAAYSGSVLSFLLNKRLSSIVSMILLIVIGSWIILGEYLKKHEKNKSDDAENDDKSILQIFKKPEIADMDNSKNIDYKEATLLGIALSINNIGGGLSAGMIGLNTFFVGLLSAIISFLALLAGNYVTEFFNKRNLGNKATILSGVALILIGIKQII